MTKKNNKQHKKKVYNIILYNKPIHNKKVKFLYLFCFCSQCVWHLCLKSAFCNKKLGNYFISTCYFWGNTFICYNKYDHGCYIFVFSFAVIKKIAFWLPVYKNNYCNLVLIFFFSHLLNGVILIHVRTVELVVRRLISLFVTVH